MAKSKKKVEKEKSVKKDNSKKVTENKEKKIIIDDDVEDIEVNEEMKKNTFEEFDDDEVVVIPKNESKPKMKENEKKDVHVVEEKHFNILGNTIVLFVISCITLVIAVISLIISCDILDRVNKLKNVGTGNVDSATGDGAGQEQVVYDTTMFKSITEDEFIALFDKKDDKKYFVYTGRSNCGWSQQFLPVAQQSIKDYDYELLYLDTNTIQKYNEVIGKSDKLKNTYGATPMVYVFKKGEIVDINEGYKDYSGYSAFLEKNDVKKK